MKACTSTLLGGIILISAGWSLAATRYVNVNSLTPAAPYSTWASAATSIQDAVDVAGAGDLIWVTNGIYAQGVRVVYDTTTNRVAITKQVTVQSVNGPGVTTIVGVGPVGPSAVRCVYMTSNAVLAGFTLTNGATQTAGDSFTNQSGGGVWCESVSAVLSNCVFTGNAAFYGGGAAYSGTLNCCVLAGNSASEGAGAYASTLNRSELRNNTASFMGGGAIGGVLNNCLLTGNSAAYGGGAGNCVVSGGTLVGNSASQWGGGAFYGMLRNCIIYYNRANVGSNHYESTIINFCCTTPLPSSGLGNFTNAPLFVNSNAWADLRLQAGSPGIDVGNNDDVVGIFDLAGNERIVGGIVDMGAYEWAAPPTPLVFAAARWLTNAMELQLTSETNAVIEIHASTNLASWTWLVALTNNTGSLLYTNTGLAGQPVRFYRAIQLP